MSKEDKVIMWGIILGVIGLTIIILPLLTIAFKVNTVVGLILLGFLLIGVSVILFQISEDM